MHLFAYLTKNFDHYVISHQMPFHYLRLFLLGQFPKNLPEVLP